MGKWTGGQAGRRRRRLFLLFDRESQADFHNLRLMPSSSFHKESVEAYICEVLQAGHTW